ncbi:hypothetical protein DPX16_21489 [Anabarilius grahami]|uniref:Uncharacterized protein n=1 Tax=Anabarilius grahami TaxID=495550 RepID=A0A3N0XVX0_ANAGA|nr:hypothetical protein DPX16_21489 [Anabarilius grahami]
MITVTCKEEVDFDGVPIGHESGFPTLMHTSFREEDDGMPQEKEMSNMVRRRIREFVNHEPSASRHVCPGASVIDLSSQELVPTLNHPLKFFLLRRPSLAC